MFSFSEIARNVMRVKKAMTRIRGRRRRDLSIELLSERTLMAVDVLDQGFGFGGQTLIDFTSSTGLEDTAVADVASDGKIVLAGRSRDGSDSSPFVGRLQANGVIDSAFGYSGFSSTRLVDNFNAVKSLPDGSILAAGRASRVGGTTDFAIVKFTATGSIDKTFGNQGVVFTDFDGGEDDVNAIVTPTGGGFFLVGTHRSPTSFNNDFAIAKYDSTGNLDATYDTDGKKIFDLNGFDDTVADAAIDSLGRLVIAGTQSYAAGVQSAADIVLARLTPSGVLDVTFSGDGKVVTDFSLLSIDQAASLTIGPGNEIYVVGRFGGDTSVLRYGNNGSLSPTFGNGGIVILPTADFAVGQDIVRDGAGTLFVSQSDLIHGREVFSIVALQESTGSVVNSFGPNGDGRTTAGFFGAGSVVPKNLLLRDNKLIGVASIDANVGLYRFLVSNGQMDNTFGQSGRVSVDVTSQSGSKDSVNAILELPNGTILAAGIGSSDDFLFTSFGVIARYLASGALDPSFAIGGRLVLSQFIDIQDIKSPDGQFLYVLGTNKYNLGSEIVRLDSKGNIDLNFGLNGFRSLPIFEANKLALDSSGEIVAVGLINGSDFGIVKLDSTGNLDSSFSGDGIQSIDFGGFERAKDVKIDSSNRFVVVGTTTNFQSDIAVARLTATGVLDVSFSGTGKVTTDVLSAGTNDEALSVALQANGFIVVGGSTFAQGNQDSVLVRFTSAGALSPTFDGDGIRIFDASLANLNDGFQTIQSDSTGRIIAVGTAQQDGLRSVETQMIISAFNGTTGAFDTTFNVEGGGTSRPDFGSYLNSTGNALVLSGDRILSAGSVDNDDALLNNFSNFGIVQLSILTGLIAPSFGVRSTVVTDFTDLGGSTSEFANAIFADPNGTSIIAGSGFSSLGSGAGLAKLRNDGTLDPTFAASGRYYNPNFNSFGDAVLLADGGVMAAGFYQPTNQFGVIKLLPSGEPDIAYGSNGIALSAFNSLLEGFVAKMIRLSNGEIFVAGSADASVGVIANNDFSIVKFDATGNLDPTFDSDGMKIIDFLGLSNDIAEDFAVDASGKLVLSGNSTLIDRTDPNITVFVQSVGTILRMTAAGVLDIGFDADGKVIIDRQGQFVSGGSLIALPDSSLVWGGSYENKFLIARINSNGTLRTSFNSTGFAETILGNFPSLNDLVLDSEGRLLAVGSSSDTAQFEPVTTIVAYNPTSGSIDSTFATQTGGILKQRSFGFEEVYAEAAVMSGNKLLVANTSESPENIIVMRFGNSDPVLTSSGPVTFVENGVAVSVAPNSSISDANSANFDGGQLTVTNTNPQVGDVILAVSTGVVSVSGSSFIIAGVSVGTFSGGLAGTPFVVNFNANTSPAHATNVLRSIFFRHTTDAPTSTGRLIALVVTDGNGGASIPITTSISVTPINDAPVISLFGAPVTYTENSLGVSVFPTNSVTDIDTPILTGGVLTITNTNGELTDRMTIASSSFVTVAGNSILVGSQVVGTFTGGTGATPLVVTLTNQASLNRVVAILSLIRFSNISDAPSVVSRIFSVRVTDGSGGTSAIVNRTVGITTVNDVPNVTLPATPVNYVENSAPIAVLTGASIADADTPVLTGGVLTITNTNGDLNDRLSIVSSSFVTVSGNSILVGSQVVGTFTGGIGTTPLVVTLTNQASLNRVVAILSLIRFSNISDRPSGVFRIISVRVTDGAGGTSTTVNRTVGVTPVNDAPVLTLPTTPVAYVENAAPLAIFTSANVTDADTTVLTGGVLTITNTNGDLNDRLSIVSSAFVIVSGNSILVGGQVVGTFTGGIGTTPLVVTFTNQASLNRVVAILSLIRFSNVSNAPSGVSRIISARVTDGSGGTSAIVNRTVGVTPVNDAPVISAIGPAVTFTRNGPRVLVFSSTSTITDLDNTVLTGGRLTIANTNGQATDSLAVVPNASITVSGANVSYNGSVIGTFTGGVGTTPLVFTFNNQATPARIRLVLLSVGFSNSSTTPSTTPRTISVQITDGFGGTSALQSKLVNVV